MGMSGVVSTGKPHRLWRATMTFPFEEYRLIPLTQDQFSKVSPEDYEWLMQWKWCARWSPKTRSYYALRSMPRKDGHHQVYMARVILGLGSGDKRLGDHRNHDTLDNRRCNLRIATRVENGRNVRVLSSNKSGVPGVCFHRRRCIWMARIRVDGKFINLGQTKIFEEAVTLRREAEKLYFGEFSLSASEASPVLWEDR